MSAATVRTVGRAGAPARPAAPSRSGAPRTAGSTRATTRPTSSRTGTSRPAEAPRRTATLRLVPQAPSRAARAPFIGVVVGLLALGLLGLLALNTSLAESSFQLHALQGQAKVLADREQALRQEVEALQAPEALASRAEALGMVPGGPPAFLRLSDGKVLGKPSPAPAVPGLASATGTAPAAPGVEVPAAALSPAPERLLSRAPVESDARGGGASSTAGADESTADDSSADGSATDGSATDGSATDGSATDRSATDRRGTDEGATGGSAADAGTGEDRDRASDDARVDDGAVDDGATDVDADASATSASDDGARR